MHVSRIGLDDYRMGLNRDCLTKHLLPPNQSLKLTEVAVDDFAARQYAENEMINRYVRAASYMEVAVRRRSLAPVR